MTSICFYFEVHQPFRIKPYGYFQIGHDPFYLDDNKNYAVLRKVSDKCYLPTTNLLLELIERYKGRFKVSFSLTGVLIEQFKMWYPEVLDNFKKLADTGCVEFLGETYYHSLSSIIEEEEFRKQVKMHTKLIQDEFGQTPKAFRNTELVYSDHIAYLAKDMGFKTILAEGAERLLHWRTPNYVYKPEHTEGIKCLLKNYKLSDDIAFRFSERGWKEFPLTAEKYSNWVHSIAGDGQTVNLFMDFETFGEHQWEDSGIFNFLNHLPEKIFQHPDFEFETVSAVSEKYEPVGTIATSDLVSWADIERDISAWLGNSIQQEAFHSLYELKNEVYALNDPGFLDTFRKLQTSDHFYYMCTKYFNDGDVHKYFNPYSSPYDAYIYFMNVLQDFRQRMKYARTAKENSTKINKRKNVSSKVKNKVKKGLPAIEKPDGLFLRKEIQIEKPQLQTA
ncbi:MAG: glycoside hydrolase family 57 protein [Spirochaetia bacterium]|nr:glycoside hydrolase family 57 protein [Spirochaetia bacterium]